MRNFLSTRCPIALLALASFFYSNMALALTVYYSGSPQKITLAYGEETIFRFDEPVKTLSNASRFSILPADEVSPDYSVLKVSPRGSRSRAEIHFILASGKVVRVEAVTVSKESGTKAHGVYDFQPKREEFSSAAQAVNLTELDLLKAMIKGDSVTGYNIKNISRKVESGHPDLKVKLTKMYSGDHFTGFVFKLENKSKKKSFDVELPKLRLGHPNSAVLSQVDEKRLAPKGIYGSSATLRIVAKSTASYYNLNLPFKEVVARK